VDLAVRDGEFLGLIGPNGKCTLLRIVAGIFPPTRGQVVVRGRLASMMELGVGFHPELTRPEGIFLSTSLFSLSDRETRGFYRQNEGFAELEEFIDMPVKNYSTGMYMRLGFAVAVHLDADILLIDDVLAVGDERFQRKCFARMEEFRRQGKTLILVSHDLGTIAPMCDRACPLVRGRIDADGEPAKVAERYRELLATPPGTG
jgi:ABC-type polysaccharide/polyol phosphate transport system ATPase subunit